MQLFKATLYRRDEGIGGYGEEIDTKRGKEWVRNRGERRLAVASE